MIFTTSEPLNFALSGVLRPPYNTLTPPYEGAPPSLRTPGLKVWK